MSHTTAVASEIERQATRISACVVCRNEEDKLEPCLQSVDWVDEIVVLDLESTDNTVELSQRYGARVVSHPPVPIVEMVRNTIAEVASGEWILVVDPDERVTPGLAGELQRAALRNDIDAVVMPRTNIDLGYAPSHWTQRFEPQLRMYRRSTVSWPTIPNALPRVPEARLYRVPKHDDLVLLHERSRNIPEVLDRSLRYAPLEAQSMLDRGQTFSAAAMFHELGATAWRQIVVAQAWKDGVPGILRAGILLGFKFYVWAAFWQLSGSRRQSADDQLLRRVGAGLEALRLAVRAIRRVGHLTRKLSRLATAR